jgi:PAS domain S-box-containing protein
MRNIKEYWDWLWDSSSWCPRTACGDWPPWLRSMHQWSDQAIFWAYVAIPCVLVYWLFAKRRKLPYPIIGVCFIVFILSCGYGHHLESTMFETPIYRAVGFVKLVTAMVSWITVFALAYITPKALMLRTAKECESEIERQTQVLRDREEELSDFFENATIGLHRVGPDGILLWANRSEMEMLGYTAEEYIGRHISDIHVDQENIAAILRRLSAGETLHNHPARLRCKNGSIRDVLISSNVANKDDQFRHTRCFTRDVTEIVAATEALQESEHKFRLLADNIPQLAWMTDPKGNVYWYNRRWYDYTGTTLEEVQGWKWEVVFDPAELERVICSWKHCLSQGIPWEDTFPLRRHDGEMRWHLSRAIPIKDEDGNILHWFGTNTDIEDIRNVKEELTSAKEAALAASKAKDQFLAVLSHEMRTPLTPCLLTASSMAIQPGTPDECRQAFLNIQRNLELEARLIDDLLDIMLIAKGKMSFHMTVIDAHHKIELAIEICQPDVIDKQITLNVDLAAVQHHITADSARFQQVIWNLVKNAVKFTPNNGTISIKTYNRGEHLVIDVQDSGIGIKPDVMPHIFDAFEQGERNKARKYGGLGLGLSISRSIVEGHRGTLQVFSDGDGQGSRFVVEFQTTYIPTLTPPKYEDSELPKDALKVFYVEDDHATRRVMIMLLQGSGYEVQACPNLTEALKIDASEWDILVSDIGLGDGTGLDLMSQLRHCGCNIPGVALSGYGTEEDVTQSLSVGFSEHLTKPVPFPTLEAAIRRVAGHRRRCT